MALSKSMAAVQLIRARDHLASTLAAVAPARHLRDHAVWQAHEAGMSDSQIARVLGMWRPDVCALRRRFREQTGVESYRDITPLHTGRPPT